MDSGGGKHFKDEPQRLGLRRVLTLVLMPIVATLVALPTTWEASQAHENFDEAVAPADQDNWLADAILAKSMEPADLDLDPTTTTTTTAAPTTTTTTTAPPIARGEFAKDASATLPTEAECAAVIGSTAETRPGNSTANNTRPASTTAEPNWGTNPGARNAMARVTGNFAGTTDQIIKWAACKWGFDADTVRAQAFVESNLRQTALGAHTDDPALCVYGEPPCARAFGIMQIRADHHPGTYPASAQSTAYNLDYALGMRRACYDGVSWLGGQTKGDLWGCIGVHYSGQWNDLDSEIYVKRVKAAQAAKSWL
jgi:hypothetical protein